MSEGRVIRVDLDSELAEDLEKVKAFLGLKNDSEVIRFLIREKARIIERLMTTEVEG